MAKTLHPVAALILTGTFYIQTAIGGAVSNVSVDAINGEISWMADGQSWYAVVTQDSNLGGASIPVISVDVPTGNETSLPAVPNCYYKGSLADSSFTAIPQTHAFINLCDNNAQFFTGFVSDVTGVYTIEGSPGNLVMSRDDPTLPLTTPNETKADNNGGKGKVLTPDNLVVRNNNPVDNFPSVEIMVEPSFIDTYGSPGYIHRIVSSVAFSNFIYEQSGMKPITLVSVNRLSEDLNRNGGIGAIRHQMQNLRRSTVQENSGDVSILMVGGDIDSTYTWGWAIDAAACELQIAVGLGKNINTIEVGRSAAFFTDLPSLIQRGWIFAHELGHAIGAEHHINGDPLMDGWFQYIDSLVDYVAGCEAKTQIFASCGIDGKSGKPNDYYSCD